MAKSSLLQKIIITLLSITLVALMIIASYLFVANSPASQQVESQTIAFDIAEGLPLTRIFHNLEKESIIRNAFFLQLYHKLLSPSITIKAGTYHIPTGLTAIKTLQYLEGKHPEYSYNLQSITIPEGLSLRETAHIWEKSGIFSAQDFLDAAMDPKLLQMFQIQSESFEGWLFPETYFVPPTITAHQAVELMANHFFRVLTEIYPSWQNLPEQELVDTVILASIVQKEHKVAEDAALMASVFKNRLAIGMRLETDATIMYAKKERQENDHVQRILFSDLQIDDPYNTYKHAGLPPSPIGLSGKTALMAAFYPATTDYLFFVLVPESNGKHHFSRNFEEHVYHANIYRKWLNQKQRS
ncbi:endolytic transglycosylase MltG [Entomospira entomophila]|uniref:Endolytic murein transglycosylase n=1 Tax=Entomospira entomophila TaxID=2719988 RepID=A0A968GC00_9SPIO|nr:endolytic transglycosylase MltG [Entomospira entomophilus]NIZ40149.1 endolytic transglycosylase MltG [Entomospira entomophilus]WDI35707.1 endolytic transglycosylase MltG [Entomospira entomophilus]